MKKLSINTFKYKRNKYLTEIQSINLLQRLHQLLSHGFTLYQSFKFLNSYFKYKERTINEKIIQHLQNGATCYDILKMIGYPELVLLQIKFAENYGNIDEALVDTVQYMKRNLKAKTTHQNLTISCCINFYLLIHINHFKYNCHTSISTTL